MRTRWRLGGLPEYAPLHLRSWLTPSATGPNPYQVPCLLDDIRDAARRTRAHHVGHTDIPVTDRHWHYVGSGHTPGAALLAAGVAEDLAAVREIDREQREVPR